MKDQHFIVKQPYLLMFETPEGKVECRLHPKPDMTHKHYGLLICDLIRHVAKCYQVDEDLVFDWINRERDKPTTTIEGGRLT